MRAIVHFSIGVTGMLVLLSFLDVEDRWKFLLVFASGFWSMIPDLGWLLLRLGFPESASLWKAVFNSPVGLIFWFSPFLDALEPVDRVLEMTSAFLVLGFGVVFHFLATDW